jgi:trehalose 6-phosphate synthase
MPEALLVNPYDVQGTAQTIQRALLMPLEEKIERHQALLAGIYRAAKIGLVTPLRDGMNLVAKEYVAAQNPEDPGVLILSRFAGAACQLTDAVLINPYSAEEMSDAIMLALRMPREERVERWQRMMDVITREDIGWWRKTFTEALMEAPLEMEQEPA